MKNLIRTVLVILMLAGPLSAATINGLVMNQRRQPVVNAPVTLMAQHGRIIQTSTNRWGSFTFEVNPGTYIVATRGDRERIMVDRRGASVILRIQQRERQYRHCNNRD